MKIQKRRKFCVTLTKFFSSKVTSLVETMCFACCEVLTKTPSCFQQETSKPNERWCRFFVILCAFSPLLTVLSSKCHNFFSILFPLNLENVIRQKFSLCLFSTSLTSFCKKLSLFCQKLRILVGNRQTKNISKKMKSSSVLGPFHPPGYTKSSKFQRVMIVRTHAMQKMEEFSFFPKKAVIYIKLLLFLEK